MKMNPMKENLTYRELIEVIDRNPYINTRLDVVGYLIERTGGVDKLDFDYILTLYKEGYIAE